VSADWPRPWLFARMLLAALLAYGLFEIGWRVFGNAKFLPGSMVIGSFVMPAAVLVLFYELNVPRNVSLLLVMRLLVLGGALSLVVSLVLFRVGADLTSLLGASAAGFVEETGKLAAVVFATRRLSPVRYRYTLNGLLFGAAVGAGFSAFESAGYAFEYLLKSKSAETMAEVVLVRGMLSPFGHPLWTAITAAALWRIKGARNIDSTMFAHASFVRLFVFSALCHVTWNSPLQLPFLAKYLLLGLAGWWVAVALVQDGLRQVQAEQRVAARWRPAREPETGHPALAAASA
jgi:RsiW-degrading membrane proteinase PrsW (M82 family)